MAGDRTAPSRPVGRPPDPERLARRREELVIGAYNEIAERGYNAASISNIAGRAGMGAATFYLYFGSKREIADAVVDYGITHAIDAMRGDAVPEAATSLEDFEAQLKAIGQRVLDLFEREPGLVRVILFEIPAIDDAARTRALDSIDAFTAFTTSYLEHGIALGYLRPDLDTESVSEGLLSLVAPIFADTLRGEVPRARRTRYVDAMVAILLAGLRR